MFSGLIALFSESKAVRWVAMVVAVVTAASLALLRAFFAGKAAKQAEINEKTLENLQTRSKTDDEIAVMRGDDVRKHLSDWVSDPERR